MKLSVELDTGKAINYELAHLDREEAFVAPASLGLTIDEGKKILAAVQTHMVTDQIARHNQALKDCRFRGRQVRTKGYYRSVFKSVFGKVSQGLLNPVLRVGNSIQAKKGKLVFASAEASGQLRRGSAGSLDLMLVFIGAPAGNPTRYECSRRRRLWAITTPGA